MTLRIDPSGASKQSQAPISHSGDRASVPADAAHDYICEMLGELSQIAKGANLKDLTALLSVTLAAARISER